MAEHQPDLVAVCADELKSALSGGDGALHADGDLHASRRNFERAYQLAVQASDVPSMALAALGLSGLWVNERRTVSGAAQLEGRLQHVLSLLTPNTSLALRVRARLAAEADYYYGESATMLSGSLFH